MALVIYWPCLFCMCRAFFGFIKQVPQPSGIPTVPTGSELLVSRRPTILLTDTPPERTAFFSPKRMVLNLGSILAWIGA